MIVDIAIRILRNYVDNMSHRDGYEDKWQDLADIAKEWQVKKYAMVIDEMSSAVVYENEEGSFAENYNKCLKYYKKISDNKPGHNVLVDYGRAEKDN